MFFKIIFTVFCLIILGTVSYGLLYLWTTRYQSSFQNFKGQVVHLSERKEIVTQLKNFGFHVNDDELFSLSDKHSTEYTADVLEAFEPKKTDEKRETEKSFYFYDEKGAYFFTLDEDGKVEADSLIPLITH